MNIPNVTDPNDLDFSLENATRVDTRFAPEAGNQEAIPEAPSSAAHYEVKMIGSFGGQAIVNTLYYRVGTDIIPGDLNYWGAEDLASAFYQHVWRDNYRAAMPAGYMLQQIIVIPRNNVWQLLTSLPYTRTVNETGASAFTTSGPAICVIGKFNLASITPTSGFFPPRRSYIACGPVSENNIDDTGYLSAQGVSNWNACLDGFAAALPVGIIAGAFVPTRVSVRKVLGVFTLRGYTDVLGCTVRPRISYRRSRTPE